MDKIKEDNVDFDKCCCVCCDRFVSNVDENGLCEDCREFIDDI